jgi:ornithine carbamoyltransferase
VTLSTPDLSQALKGRPLTRVEDFGADELRALLDLADELKELQQRREPHELLPGRSLGMIFQRPSTRTRVSFEVGIGQLGGRGLYLAERDLQLSRGETIRDTANTLSRYLDAIVIRTAAQADVDELAAHASVPVINGLTDEAHPCQALADVMTIRERFGRLEGLRVAWVGDGNNVCTSLAAACMMLGARVVVACPHGYEPDSEVEVVRDPREAARGAQVLYTDVWTSMGRERERVRRRADLAAYRIDAALLAVASEDAIVMHCLPARYGEEIDENVLYGPQSTVWDQAENRLHAQKGLMALVIR